MVRDIGIGVGIIITTILCPPLGAATAVVYGGVQIKSGIDGEDWGTHRKLSQEERVGNIIFGGLDAIPVVGAVGKGVKAFKGTSELADLAKLLKFKEGMPGFNPNLGKNVVQSLKENNLLKNLKIQGWKTVDKINDADYFIKGLVAKGVDSVTPFAKGVEIMPDGSVVRSGTNYSGKFQEAHDASKASIQSKISNLESGGVKGTGDSGIPPRYGERKITDEEYEALRKKTPTAKIRKQVNKGHNKKIETEDQALPGKTFIGSLEADHIVSMDRIASMDGFGNLTEKQQLEVLNNPENFTGLSKSANTSKQSKSYEEWTHYKKGTPDEIEVSLDFRSKMITREKQLERILQKQIDDFKKE
ncbi:Uncharacterised protein [Streptococcus pneumoniae]|nr:Uncharacterised protein [Streptococcus pneumoniae]